MRPSPWKPVVWTREYRFRDIGRVVTVRAECDRDDYAMAVADTRHDLGVSLAQVARIVTLRMERGMMRAANKERRRWPAVTPPTRAALPQERTP